MFPWYWTSFANAEASLAIGQGNSSMESQETLAQLFQLAIANGSGPRGSTSPFGYYGIVMLFFVFRDLLFVVLALFCGSGTPFS